MTKFAAVLQAPDSGHTRHTAVYAATEADARREIARREAEMVAYTLDGDVARAETLTDGSGLVRVGLNEGDYDKVLRDYRFDDTGRVVFTGGPGTGDARLRGKLAQHHQRAPFEIRSLTEVNPDLERVRAMIREAQRLSASNAPMWQAFLDGLQQAGVPINAVTAAIYGVALKDHFSGAAVWDWDTDTIKCSLHTAYSADFDTHDRFNDVSGSEVTGTNYTSGGHTLSCSAPTYDTGSDQVRCDATDLSIATSTISATDAIIRKDTGTASTSPLIVGIDFGATVSTTAGTFAIVFDSTGVFVIDCT
jgi:hypothetical protein